MATIALKAACPEHVHDFAVKLLSSAMNAVRRRIAYHETVSGLESLSIRELEDIGLAGADLRDTAFEAVYGKNG